MGQQAAGRPRCAAYTEDASTGDGHRRRVSSGGGSGPGQAPWFGLKFGTGAWAKVFG